MALSPAAISEIRREITNLLAQRDALNDHIQALQKVVGDEPQPKKFVFKVKRNRPAEPVSENSAEDTWKDTVKAVLRENPGVKAAQITRILRERGESPGGTTRLSHRVYNEVWRMYKTGEARKTDDGGFVLNE